jgi:YHS domain-containing protein
VSLDHNRAELSPDSGKPLHLNQQESDIGSAPVANKRATDPVCDMIVNQATTPHHYLYQQRTYSFVSRAAGQNSLPIRRY